MSTHTVLFDKGIEFDPKALEHLQLTDPQVLNEYMQSYRDLIKSDLEQVTQFENAR
jgi:hypothetical protein